MIWRDALAVKRINTTSLAKEMTCGHCVELVFAKTLSAGQKLESGLVDLNHQGILAATD